jgi:DNA modification methylase
MPKIELIQGDCLDEIQNIQDDFIIVTDPPFNIGYHYNSYKDNLKEDKYYEMLDLVFRGKKFVVIHYPEQMYKIAHQLKMFPEKVISWVYNSALPKQHRDIAFFGVKPDLRKGKQEYKNPLDKRIAKMIAEGKAARLYDWWNINQVKNVSKSKTDHPCQMPLKVMENIISILPDDKIILDPFMGSGTTGVACKNLNRDFIGIELDPEYFKIAEKRINENL